MVKLIVIFLVVVAVSSSVEADIIRPCLGSNNKHHYKCIRDNLAANSNCNPDVKGMLPNKYLVKEFKFETPYFNSSYIDRNMIVRNHDKCFVSEFFLNTDTNTAVLAIDCPDLDLESDRVLIQHRSKKEDTFYYFHIHGTYPLIRVTVNLYGWNGLDLCKARAFAEVTALPYFHINPQDKPTENFLTRDLTELMTYEREMFFYRGDSLMKGFLDAFVCDYQCKLHTTQPLHNEDLKDIFLQ